MGLEALNRGGDSEAMNAGAPPLVSRLRFVSRNVPGVKIVPAASATPGVARTWASSWSVIGEVCERVFRPRAWVGVTTTSLPLFAVWKIVANDLLMVSVRT